MSTNNHTLALFFSLLAVFLALCYTQSPALGSNTATPTTLPSTTNHQNHAILQGNFTNPEEVTKACLSCHNEAAKQIHKTIHWTWRYSEDPEGRHGKGGISFNNFCVSIPTNEPRCTSCHIGYGWKDASFDFSREDKVDCLVCHDNTKSYKKLPTGSGYPAQKETVMEGTTYSPPDYTHIATSIGRPHRENCGNCHFYGGGGDAVKHGDLDSSLLNASRELDVHLSPEGGDFSCQRCHTTVEHHIAGRIYASPAFVERTELTSDDLASRIACESCHTATPHKDGHKANDHTDKVSCQACHIPSFAREVPTKMRWDWSTAGKKENGKPYVRKDDQGNTVYDSKKGDFIWEKDVRPIYRWYSGAMDHMLLTDKVDITEPVEITKIIGNSLDPRARIMPFKAHTGKQPFDPVNKTFLAPHLFGSDDTAYWKNFDWGKALETGQASLDLPYSGEYVFAETVYYYPITHMVAPKENAVACSSCHSRDSRLGGIDGVWMPARDHSALLDGLGWFMVAGTLGATGIHGIMRFFSRRRQQKGGKK